MSRYKIDPPPADEIDLFEKQFPEMGKWLRLLTNKLKPEPWREIDDAAGKNPGFQNSWANFGGSYETAAFYKDLFGRVFLKGSVASGSTGTVAFTFPEGYRPAASVNYPVSGDVSGGGYGANNAETVINSAGALTIYFAGGGTATRLALDGISWRV